jgi:hypothetical protein
MKVSFKELIGSDAYQQHAQAYAKAMIFISLIALLVNYYFREDATLIGTILLAVSWSVFGAGILIAVPCYSIYVWIISKMSEFSEFPTGEATSSKAKRWRRLASLWSTVSYVINIYLTSLVARYYWS